MDKYKSLTRTTLAQTDNLPNEGIYIVAYMGRILYIGKAMTGIADRLQQHIHNAQYELLGLWMLRLHADWHNVRLDVLEAPDEGLEVWIKQAERELIRRFEPLFNVQFMA